MMLLKALAVVLGLAFLLFGYFIYFKNANCNNKLDTPW